MKSWTILRHAATAGALVCNLSAARAADLDPAAVVFKLPDQIKWTENPAGGNANAVVHGDPSKPGLYIVLVKWHPGYMSHPHFHPPHRPFHHGDLGNMVGRFGHQVAPEDTVPMPAGSFVTHYGKQVHYDGAKDGDTVLEIVGEGPATATPAEQK